jgi:hypothetical protein
VERPWWRPNVTADDARQRVYLATAVIVLGCALALVLPSAWGFLALPVLVAVAWTSMRATVAVMSVRRAQREDRAPVRPGGKE